MTECSVPAKKSSSRLTIELILVVVVCAIFGVLITPFSKLFIPSLESVIDTLLTITTDLIYLVGGGILLFGVLVVTIRFIQCKLQDPYKPSCVTRFLSGYLTLALEFFIGAEIIKTVVVRTYEEFTLLILVIISRGLFSLILYLERRWHGAAETE
ncbi:MAG: DUF1622 domain-containing protein [Candidatus Bathyarchaeota archaeon]|jgi:uncharacterized membrane protein|nr:DUF1622 domain-containing protein [Candidatus Bathyarchaeota archaeon]